MRRLLLVEDDVSQAWALSLRLRGAGYDVVMAFDVKTADHLLADQPFDAIVCDLFLPPQSGLDVLDVVERRGLATPFLLMSGSRPDEHDWVSRKYPRVAAFVPKPCRLDELLRILDRAMAPAS